MDECATWDGYVLSIGRKYFWARLADEFDARIPIAKVTQRDRSVFQVGALFNLRLRRGGGSLKFSHRRYTKAEITAAKKAAARLSKQFTGSAAGDEHGTSR